MGITGTAHGYQPWPSSSFETGSKVEGRTVEKRLEKKILQLEIKERGYIGRKSNFLMWNELSCKEECFEFAKSHSTAPAGRGR